MKFVKPACPDCGFQLDSKFYCSENDGSFGVRLDCYRCCRVVCLSLDNNTFSSADVDLNLIFFVPRFPCSDW